MHALRDWKLTLLIGLAAIISGCPTGTPNGPPGGGTTEATTAAVSDLENDMFTPETGFRLLTLADFEPFLADAQTWSEVGKTIICSGAPKGYAHTRENFEDFTLRCEFRYVVAGEPPKGAEADKYNTGFMIHIQEPHKVWPVSLEVQGRYDEIAWIKGNGGATATEVVDDAISRSAARLPVGQWNEIEIVSRNGALTSRLNGMVISTCQPGELTSGQLGLQSEGFEVQFKHLRVRVDE